MRTDFGWSEEWWIQFLITFIGEKVNPSVELNADTMLDDCLVDSLDLVELVMAIEDDLKIEISDKKLAGKVRTIGDLARALSQTD